MPLPRPTVPARRRRPRPARPPWPRRLAAQPRVLLRGVVVGVLALGTGAVVHGALVRAAQAEARWGSGTPVLVATRAVPDGRPVAAAVRLTRRPRAVVPAGALRRTPAGAVADGPLAPGEVVTASALRSADEARLDQRRVALPRGAAPLPVRRGDVVDVWAVSLAGDGPVGAERVAHRARVASVGRDVVVVAVAPADLGPTVAAAARGTVALSA